MSLQQHWRMVEVFVVSMPKDRAACQDRQADSICKDYGAKGLAYVAIQEDGTVKSSFAKFMTEEQMQALIAAMNGEAGDLLLFAADRIKWYRDSLGALRMHCEAA